MDFALSDEQQALQASVREVLADRYPPERVAEIADSPGGFESAGWAEVAELGWASVAVPEDAGGLGMGFVEEALILEELGHGLFPGPFLSSVTMALPALTPDSDLTQRVGSGKSAATVAWGDGDDDRAMEAERDGDGWRLSGAATFVPDLGSADLVVAAARTPDRPGLFAVERDGDGSAWEELPTVDSTRRMGRLELNDAAGRDLVVGDEAGSVAAATRRRALAGLAAEAVGVASRALELGVQYAGEREQFGRKIGVYQAVSHRLADVYVAVENARSLAYWAAWAVEQDADDAEGAAAAAKAAASEAAVAACEAAIQVHGGLGFTWEHPLQRFYKRALGTSAWLGWPAEHRARIAATLLD
ncbi:MAG: acyl-CoA dehydrogenase family protein [Actinomycetota bacterium]